MSLTRIKMKAVEECIEPASVHGLPLEAGDKVVIRIRGKAREELECEFICFNPIYGTLQLKCGDDIYLVKMSSLLYLKTKPKEKKKKKKS